MLCSLPFLPGIAFLHLRADTTNLRPLLYPPTIVILVILNAPHVGLAWAGNEIISQLTRGLHDNLPEQSTYPGNCFGAIERRPASTRWTKESELLMSLCSERRHVLICENDGVTIVALRKALSWAGYVIVGVEGHSERAIGTAKQLRPDWILMDIGLDGTYSGIDAARQILLEYDVPIIMLSGYGDEDHIAAAIQAGACGYLVKPLTKEHVLTAIDSLLTYKQQVQAVQEMVAAVRRKRGRKAD